MSAQVINQHITEQCAIYHGDNIDIAKSLPSESIDYMIFSPPFASLFTYSDSERDLGNCRTYEEFFTQYRFLTAELYRLLKPGRLMSVHCMNLPMSKQNHGVIGLQDFRGDLVSHHREDGFIFHSEVTIWKDPVVQMQRTKSIGLLYKQLRKDSALSRQGLPEYLLTFRKPGENKDPITKNADDFSLPRWQNYASPVWMDINPSETLQGFSAREDEDERHIAPLQLGVIERGIELWSNQGDIVMDPFGGIGSTAVVATRMGRRSVLCELKESYYKQAVANVVEETRQATLF